MEQKARELFAECDREGKGYVLKKDLEKLRDDLGLTTEQLGQVFDVLDRDENGFLTLEEFMDGFGMFMGPPPTPNGLSSPMDDEFDFFLESLGAQNLFPDEDQIRKVWAHLRKADPTMQNQLEEFLSRISGEMRRSQMEYTSLESALKNRETEHGHHLQNLYQEMEHQIACEKEEALAMEKAKEKKLREDLEFELAQRDQLLNDLGKRHKMFETRLETLRAWDTQTKQENTQLQKEKEELEANLAHYQRMVAELRRSLERIHTSNLEERRRRERAAVEASENVILERETLIQQLDVLREVNRRLLDEKDAAHAKGSDSDCSLESFPRRGRSIRESIAAVEFISEAIQHPLTDVLQNNLNRDDTSPEAGSDSEVDNTLASRKVTTSRPRRHSKTTMEKKLPATNHEVQYPKTPERLFKVIIIGDSGVGKTSFLQQFCHGTFRSSFRATVGVDFYVRSLEVDGSHSVVMQLWDTAGQEKFLSITKQYFRKADGVVVMFDTTSETTFKNVRNWTTCIKESGEEGVVQLLLGNKIDLCESEDDRVVRPKDGMRLAEEVGAIFYETSSKTGAGVVEAMKAMALLLRAKEDEEMEKVLRLQEAVKKRRCC